MESKKAAWVALAISFLISLLLAAPLSAKVFDQTSFPFSLIFLVIWMQSWLWLVNNELRNKHRSDINRASVVLGALSLIMLWLSLTNL